MLIAILTSRIRPPLVEIAAIADTLHEANVQSGQEHYHVVLVSERREAVRSAAGPTIAADVTFDEVSEPIDTLIAIPATRGTPMPSTPATTEWLRMVAPRTRRFGSTCTGAFALGAAGLLSGRRVTTHWQFAAELAALYPEAIVEPDRIFVRDGPMFSCAGVTTAFDLMLSLIEEDLGRETALAVARFFVMFLKRPGGQSQFSAQLAAQFVSREPIQRAQHWIHHHLRNGLSVSELAREVGMSQRNFARTFANETDMTPAAYVELARIDAGRRLLEESHLSLQEIAFEGGFSNPQAMRRAFSRHLGLTPGDYRQRFQSASQSGGSRDRGKRLSPEAAARTAALGGPRGSILNIGKA
jgi:transcriptional regulator GlxA family with amidase domain